MSTDGAGKLPVKLLRALYWAEWHMKEALAACIHAHEIQNLSGPLKHAIFTAIVVSYARPFNASQGLSVLGKEYRTFPTVAARQLHDAVLESRDLIYAHNDRIAEPKTFTHGESPSELNKVSILISKTGRARWAIRRSGFQVDKIDEIAALCDFQIKRIHRDSTRMLHHFHSGRQYYPGEYILGQDFP